MPAKPKRARKKIITNAKQAITLISSEETLEHNAQKNVPQNAPKRNDNERIEAQQAFARGDYGPFWEKCFAPLDRTRNELFAMERQFLEAMLAKMQAMEAMREISPRATQRLQEGWTRGLSREQMYEVLTQKYNEELRAKLQDHPNKTADDWKKLRLPYIELIKWSKLPERSLKSCEGK